MSCYRCNQGYLPCDDIECALCAMDTEWRCDHSKRCACTQPECEDCGKVVGNCWHIDDDGRKRCRTCALIEGYDMGDEPPRRSAWERLAEA